MRASTKWPMRALAMTGMLTTSMMRLTMVGSAMRAMPPAARMSAGTRSRAMTAQAPASSAIFACSGVVTSMMTPPLSISARPVFRRMVPCSISSTPYGTVGRCAGCVGPLAARRALYAISLPVTITIRRQAVFPAGCGYRPAARISGAGLEDLSAAIGGPPAVTAFPARALLRAGAAAVREGRLCPCNGVPLWRMLKTPA